MNRTAIAFEDWMVDEEQEDYAPLNIPGEYRHLNAEQVSISVRQLWESFLQGKVVLEPDFQRSYIWDSTRASRYIESLLLGIPTPAIFISEEIDDRWLVIDGHQRLETLFRYMQKLLRGPAKAAGATALPFYLLPPMSLRGLEVLSELNGTDITDLDAEDRQKLWDRKLPIVHIHKETHPELKYVIFARLNLGSVSLNPQELRNCLYRGPYNRLLAELSEDRAFLEIWGKDKPDKRMSHRELVLRFFALLHMRDRYRTPFRAFLNEEMKENRDAESESLQRFQHEFESAVTWTNRVFGREALRPFRIGSVDDRRGRWGRNRSALIYELEMVGFAEYRHPLDKYWEEADAEERRWFCLYLRSRLIDVMTDPRFTVLLIEGTKKPSSVESRFEMWLDALDSAVSDPESAAVQGRLIDSSLRRSNQCFICHSTITPDDAIWMSIGGTTSLVHRFCGRGSSGG